MDEQLKTIEAALFMSSRSLTAMEIGKLIKVAAPGYVDTKVKELMSEYEKFGSSVKVVCEDGKYYMTLRGEYAQVAKEFAKEAEISRHALKTLAYINKFNGITKRELFRKLGSTIYNDVAELVEKGFVEQKRAGRSKSVRTTQKFKEYFSELAPAPE
ncbi:Segregation and condensation protein B [Candidatus Anstonella stagnisolia]|nr:Segregation and condensation protein B [Candidatus Anstonella stagnisolia]